MSEEQSITTPPVEYRPIEGFPGYRVGNDGSVWSQWRRAMPGMKGFRSHRGEEWCRLNPGLVKGYPVAMLRRDKKTYQRKVHHLVLEAFVGPRPAGLQCCHEDDCGANNSSTNLSWGTAKKNAADRDRNGNTKRGKRTITFKLTEPDIHAIRRRAASGELHRVIAASYGVSRAMVTMIVSRKAWSWLKQA